MEESLAVQQMPRDKYFNTFYPAHFFDVSVIGVHEMISCLFIWRRLFTLVLLPLSVGHGCVKLLKSTCKTLFTNFEIFL